MKGLVYTIAIRPHSLDQSQLLGSDKLGYRSVHYVAMFDKGRCRLPEYKQYENIYFEIQIRSILQHAWAEIEHDRNYKFSGKLPTQLERRFYLVSGMLECADREFVAIAREIDVYKNTVVEEINKGDLDIEINTASLREYMTKKFDKLVKEKLLITDIGSSEFGAKIIEELNLYGIRKISQLDKIIPGDYEDNILKEKLHSLNLFGFLRHILMANDAKKYFEVCWRKAWTAMRREDVEFLEKYFDDVAYIRKYVKHIIG